MNGEQIVSGATSLPVCANAVVAVIGAGCSGMAAVRLLHRSGAQVRLLERSANNVPADFVQWAGQAGVEIITGEHSPEHFADVQLMVPSPGVPASMLRAFLPLDESIDIMAETELAYRYLTSEKVLAVTGTSGKTTTTSLAAAMLEAQGLSVFTGGNIGTPLSEYVLQVMDNAPRADVVVLELSSFQLQTCSTLHPHVAVLLNISENHLDYHENMDEYIDAKMRLFQCQHADDVAVIHPDLHEVADRYSLKARRVFVTRPSAFPDTRLMGPHNQFNAEAAWLACREFGVTEENARRAVAAFEPIAHRLEKVGVVNGVLYVNDSKATTVDAMRVALNAFDAPVLLLAGGKFKGGDLEGLRELVHQKVKAVGLFGAGREYFEKAWAKSVPLYYDETLELAMQRLADMADAGDVVLLAPATASYDQYVNYLRRGDDFKRVVREVLA